MFGAQRHPEVLVNQQMNRNNALQAALELCHC